MNLPALVRSLARIGASQEPQETLQAAVEGTREIFGADMVSIRLLDEAAAALVLAASSGLPAGEAGRLPARLPLGGPGIAPQVARTRAPLCLGDRGEIARRTTGSFARLGMASTLCAPLLVRERLLGTLLLASRTPGAFGADHVALAEAVALVVASALDRAFLNGEAERLYAAALKARARAETLAAVGQAISASLDLDDVLAVLVDRTVASTGADMVAVAERDPLAGALRTRRAHGLSATLPEGLDPLEAQGICGAALAAGGPVWSEDLPADPGFPLPDEARQALVTQGIRGILAAPIGAGSEPYGILQLAWRAPHHPDPEEVAFVAQVADQAAVAIGKARLLQEALTRAARRESLARLSTAIAAGTDRGWIMRQVADATASLLNAPYAVLWRMDPAGERLLPAAEFFSPALGAPTPQEPIQAVPSLAGTVIGDGQAVAIPDVRADPRWRNPAWPLLGPLGAYVGVPLEKEGTVVGALAAMDRPGRRFGADEIELLSTLGTHAILALEKAELLEAARRAAERAEALAAVGQALSASLDPDQVLALLVERAAAATGADSVAVLERDPATGSLRFRRAYGLSAGYWQAVTIPPGEGVAGAALAAGAPRWTPDIRSDPLYRVPALDAFNAAEGLRAILSVPILCAGEPYGILNLHRRTPGAFDSQEIAFATRIAEQAAIAIENARLYREAQASLETIQRQHASAQALLEVSQALTRTLDLERVFDLIAEKVLEVTGADACGISRVTPEGDLEYVRARGFSGPSFLHMTLQRGEGLMGRCLEAGAPVWSRDLQTDPTIRFRPERRARIQMRGGLAVPIVTPDGPSGVLFIGRRAPYDHAPDEIAFAQALAAQAAVAIENARLYAETREALQQLAAIHEAGQALAESLDLELTLSRIAESARHLAGADRALVWLVEEAEDCLRAGVASGPGAEAFLGTRVPVESPAACARAVREGRPIVLSDALDPGAPGDPALSARLGNAALLAIPFRARAAISGVLVCGYDQPHRVSQAEVDRLSGLAQQAGIAIQNARLFQEEQARRRQVEAVRAVTVEITRELDVTALLGLITRRAAELLGVPSGAVFLWDEAAQVLVPRAWTGLGDYMRDVCLRLGESITGMVAQQRRGMVVNDYRAWPPASPVWLELSGITACVAEPLLYGDRLLGVITINNEGAARPFTEQDRETLALFAGQAAIAIENARLYAQARETLEELTAIHEATRNIAQSLDLHETLQRLLAVAMRLTDTDKGAVHLLDPERQELVVMALAGAGGAYPARLPLAEPSLAAACLREGRTLIAEDPDTDPRCNPAIQAALRNRSLIAVPLRLGDRLIGALDLGDLKRRRPFPPRQVAILERLAQQAAVAIENARLFREEQERRRQVEAVRAVSQEVARELDLPTLLALIRQRAAELVRADSGTIYLWDEAAQVLVPRAWKPAEPWRGEVRFRLGEGLSGTVAQRRQGLIVNDYRASPYASPLFLERTGITAALAEPLLYRDRLLGVITLDSQEAGRAFTEQDREILALFAGQAAIAIENARLYAEAQHAYEDLKAAQEQLLQVEKLKALGEMAGGVAHDFNNTLAAILGQAQLLRLRSTDPQVRSALKLIEHAALDGAETVRRILGFARVRSQGQPAPVDLAALLPPVMEVTRPRWRDEAQARGIHIEMELALEPVPPVLGNAAELREVLVNLIFNAVDAMPRGGRITLGGRRLLRPARGGGAVNPHRRVLDDQAEATEELVEVFVRDTGIGMSEEVRRRAFDPFFTTKGVKGTGLGLSVVYGIVSRHGGEVLLESQEGAGTTVTLRLPVATGTAAAADQAPAPPPIRAARIAVLDDEQALADLLAELLRLQRHQVAVFTDPRRALDHVAREPVDLLFTDLGMPEMSGWDVAAAARALRPDLPVVLITGWGHQIDASQVRRARVRAVVAKPYRVEDLLRVVAECLAPQPPPA